MSKQPGVEMSARSTDGAPGYISARVLEQVDRHV